MGCILKCVIKDCFRARHPPFHFNARECPRGPSGSSDLVMNVYKEGYPSVQEQVRKVREDIARRKRELDSDLNSNVVVENRVITERFAQIHGLKNHLNKARQTKAVYNNQEVQDQFGHGTVSRGQLHRRNPTKY